MAKKLSIWGDNTGIGSLGRLIIIYIMIGASIFAASEAYKAQAAIYRTGNITIMTSAINVSNLSIAGLPNTVSGSEGVTSGTESVNVMGASWDLLKSLGQVMFWPQMLIDQMISESCTPPCQSMWLVSKIGYIFTIMFLVAAAYFFRSGT